MAPVCSKKSSRNDRHVFICIWSADLFSVLDANFTVRVQWGNLQYGVPPNNVLHLHVDTGRVNATCYDVNNVARGSRHAFEFHFENINGHGGIDYDRDKGAIALKVTDWELNMSTIVLDYPPVFLPEEFIDDMMKNAVNSSTTAANAFLFSHPYYLPDGFKARVPDPIITIHHQDSSCCNNEHGYVEILSECSCIGPQPHMPDCHGIACLPTSQLESLATIPKSFLPRSLSRKIPGIRAPTRYHADLGGAIIVTLFSNPATGGAGAGNLTSCSLDNMGDSAVMLQLPSTAGQCQTVPPVLIAALYGTPPPGAQAPQVYYSLTRFDNNSISLQLLCYDNACSQCVHDVGPPMPAAADWSGFCERLPSSAVYLQASGGGSEQVPCFGPTQGAMGTLANVMFVGQYSNDKCDTSLTIGQISKITNMGKYDSSIQLPCRVMQIQPGQGWGFQVKSRDMTAGVVNYTVSAFCASGCQQPSCSVSFSFTEQGQHQEGKAWSCVTNPKGGSNKLVFGNKLPMCHESVPTMSPPVIPSAFNLPAWGTASIVVSVLAVLVFGIRWATQRQGGAWLEENVSSNCQKCCDNSQENMGNLNARCNTCCRDSWEWCTTACASAYAWLCDYASSVWRGFVSVYLSVTKRLRCGRPERRLVFDAINFLLLLTLLCSFAQYYFWNDDTLNPLAVFRRETFVEWGIPVDNFDMVPFLQAVQFWKDWGYYVSLGTLSVISLLCLFRACLVESIPDQLVYYSLFFVWLGQFYVYFVYPLFFHFSQLITLRAESIDYLRTHPDEVSTVTKVGSFSFSVLATTYIVNMEVFVLHALSFGVWVGCVLWRLPCLRVRLPGDANNVEHPQAILNGGREPALADDEAAGLRMQLLFGGKADRSSGFKEFSSMSASRLSDNFSLNASGKKPSIASIASWSEAAGPSDADDQFIAKAQLPPYNSWVMALDLFSVVFIVFMPLALTAPALVLFYLVGSSYTWIWSWVFYWGGAIAGAIFIHMLTLSDRVDKLQFSTSHIMPAQQMCSGLGFAGAIFVAANVTSLVLSLQQETTFVFFRLKYTAVAWLQFMCLTATTITVMYSLARQRTESSLDDTQVLLKMLRKQQEVEPEAKRQVHETDAVSGVVGTIIALIVRLLFCPFLIFTGLRKLLHACVEQVTYFAEAQFLQWDMFCTDEALENDGVFRFLYYIFKQIIGIPVIVAFTVALNTLRALRSFFFMTTKPLHDKLPGVKGRLDFRNMFLLVGTACLIAQLIISHGKLQIPAREEFSEMAEHAGYHLHWPAGPSFLDNPFKLYVGGSFTFFCWLGSDSR
jgi:hypothetical protein